jgi:lipid II:glycine glycyltransferase (peptidoglycan interpeptide bridge formation enzyme)
MPGLYVTGDLYLPKGQTQPAPAILYVCGHGKVVKDGVSLGNKTYYQHHGEWFARNGYVCLAIDTVELGEIAGVRELSHDLERQAEELRELNQKLQETSLAREQAEAVINRQGERITALQANLAEVERRVADQSEQIADLSRERESLVERLPTKEDADALAAMSALLMKKVSGREANKANGPTMRIAEAA